jgi:hypothetical protein
MSPEEISKFDELRERALANFAKLKDGVARKTMGAAHDERGESRAGVAELDAIIAELRALLFAPIRDEVVAFKLALLRSKS